MNRYGFVHMAREEDAASAIKALHNSNFKGATINVEPSTGKSRGGGPGPVGGRRDDRRTGLMRGGRGGRDGGRDVRPGPYNDRRGLSKLLTSFDNKTEQRSSFYEKKSRFPIVTNSLRSDMPNTDLSTEL